MITKSFFLLSNKNSSVVSDVEIFQAACNMNDFQSLHQSRDFFSEKNGTFEK